MKTIFKLRYDSRWGEELFLTGNSTELGNWNTNKALPMEYVGPGIGSATVETRRATSLLTTATSSWPSSVYRPAPRRSVNGGAPFTAPLP